MEQLGFVFLGEIDHWNLSVLLPPGWYKERDILHRGWSLVSDAEDRLRCRIMEGHRDFASVYADWQRRHDYDLQWHPHNPCGLRWLILDGGNIEFDSDWSVGRPDRMVKFAASCSRKAVRYINARYPQWRDLLAYW